MTPEQIQEKIAKLPPEIQKQVSNFIDFQLYKIQRQKDRVEVPDKLRN
jgi:mRNA-degrading endonuclease RelE of RelBE toxin-antitoxin system